MKAAGGCAPSQAHGLIIDSDSYKQRDAFDVWYVENWSLWNDIVIFLKTVYVVLARKGTY